MQSPGSPAHSRAVHIDPIWVNLRSLAVAWQAFDQPHEMRKPGNRYWPRTIGITGNRAFEEFGCFGRSSIWLMTLQDSCRN